VATLSDRRYTTSPVESDGRHVADDVAYPALLMRRFTLGSVIGPGNPNLPLSSVMTLCAAGALARISTVAPATGRWTVSRTCPPITEEEEAADDVAMAVGAVDEHARASGPRAATTNNSDENLRG